MANKRVGLVRRVRVDGSWKYLQPFVSERGRTSPDLVKINGGITSVTGGFWYLTWYEGSKKRRQPVSRSLTDAVNAQHKRRQLLAAKNAGIEVKEDDERKRLTVDAAIETFLNRVGKKRGSRDRIDLYRVVLSGFRGSSKKRFVDEITSYDVLEYISSLTRGKDAVSDRTAFNRWIALGTFFRSEAVKQAGLDIGRVMLKGDRPKYTEKVPRIYSEDELSKLLAAGDEYSGLVFETLAKTGFRYQELAHAEWTDLSFTDKAIRVTAKPHWGFRPKDSEERAVPLDDDLLGKLRAWRKKRPKTRLIFGTSGDRPHRHWLPLLKKAARNANLNCSHCSGCVERDECEQYYLHRFRSTYITRLLRAGLDLSKVMRLSGHSDLDSVRRYIEVEQDPAVRDAVLAAFAGMTAISPEEAESGAAD